jgi:hypothetical protein
MTNLKGVSWKELLLTGISISVTLVVGEAGARHLMPPTLHIQRTAAAESETIRSSIHVYDPEIGWVLSPNHVKRRHRYIGADGSVHYDVVYTVDHGARVTSLEAHAGDPVVVTTGCSFTFGHGVNDQDSWPWLLQERLPRYRVVNVGAMGYGTDQALLAAQRQVEQFAGHVRAVALGFADFQIERNRGPQGWLAITFPFGKPLFVQHGDGVELRRQVKFWYLGAVQDHSELVSHLASAVANRAYGIPSHEQARQLTLALIEDANRRLQARHISFTVVVLPYRGDQAPVARSDRKFILDHLRADGVETLEAHIPRSADGDLDVRQFLVSNEDKHPNRQYHVRIADQVKKFLEAAAQSPAGDGGSVALVQH